MPNSSGGQQEQEEEEQDGKQVVKSRIAVRRIPIGIRMRSEMFRLTLHLKLESSLMPVKAYRIMVPSEKRMLRQVAFTEKVISTSFCELRLLQQHSVFDSNEKKVKAGKSSREG